jgi:hypothetical protein
MSNKLKLYQENFQIVILAYAAGIKSYPGEIYDELVFIFLKDLEPMFVEALKYEYAFDILDIAEKFCEASMFRLSPEGVVETLLSLFPHPSELNMIEQDTLIKILELVDSSLPGTIERIQYEWRQAA